MATQLHRQKFPKFQTNPRSRASSCAKTRSNLSVRTGLVAGVAVASTKDATSGVDRAGSLADCGVTTLTPLRKIASPINPVFRRLDVLARLETLSNPFRATSSPIAA